MKRLVALGVLSASTAHAGGLARPNGISARGVGMGGAFTAFADDVTALYFNPAGLADAEPQAQIGGELVIGPRTYTPPGAAAQRASIVAPTPTVGVLGRFSGDDDRPSRLTLGVGAWNTFGGKLTYPRTGMPAFDSTEDVVFESSGGAALRISDKLAVGAAVRVGLGLFQTTATQRPFDAELAASGVGVGAATGVVYRPIPAVQIGVAWRSKMSIATTGTGSVTTIAGGAPTSTTVSHAQRWPQSASLGVGLRPTATLKLAAQLDWTAWSTIEALVVDVEALGAAGVQRYPEAWRDTWTARAGAELQLTSTLAARAGTYVDTSAVPDRTIERQYYDTTKYGLAAGATLAHDAWRFDAALDAVIAPTRVVPDNTLQTAPFPADRNLAPGSYAGTLVTFELSVAHRF